MRIGIMQPYFLPYIGYFQLIAAVDIFVVYDNIEYTKKGWINRNRILSGEHDEMLTLPLKKDSDFLNIDNRYLSDVFDPKKLLRKINASYFRAPFYHETIPLAETILNFKERNLFNFIIHSIIKINQHLLISTPIVHSSEILIDHNLKSEDKVIAICKQLNADEYINPVGGAELYSRDRFRKKAVQLKYIQCDHIEYSQFNQSFIQRLSIIDVLMFNGKEATRELLSKYQFI